jgi:valyl-tRNA synthetase
VTGDLRLEDRWILSRLDVMMRTVNEAFDTYDLSLAARALYHFVWDEYCDWYLELAKLRDDPVVAQVLVGVLDVALRLLHPIAPFVTEEIWRQLNRTEHRTIMRAPWPCPVEGLRHVEAEIQFDALRDTVSALRRFRADHGLSPAARLEVIAVASDGERSVLEAGLDGIGRLAGIGSWSFAAEPPDNGPVGKVVVNGVELFISLVDLIDLDEERSRLRRELKRALAQRDRAADKLATSGFVANAPEPVVEAARAKLADVQTMIDKLESQLQQLGSAQRSA